MTRFTPAGYAFSIWGLIFTFLGFFIIYQALPSQRKKLEYKADDRVPKENFVLKIGPFFILNGIFCGSWSIIFGFEIIWLSLVFMFGLLGTLIYIYNKLSIRISGGIRQKYKELKLKSVDKTSELIQYWIVDFTFSIYLGWISVATLANIAVFFVCYVNWTERTLEVLSIIMQIFATFLGLSFNFFFADSAYSGVITWALIAIGVGQSEYKLVSNSAYLLASIVGVSTIATTIWRIRRFINNY